MRWPGSTSWAWTMRPVSSTSRAMPSACSRLCDDRLVPRVNVFSADCEYDDTDPAGYHSGMARVGDEAGGKALVVKVFELPAGQALCPYHYEYEEEWLVVLDGVVVVRTPDGEEELARGEVLCF